MKRKKSKEETERESRTELSKPSVGQKRISIHKLLIEV